MSQIYKDVIIIYNPGGWGNVPLEKANDFEPIIKGIKSVLVDRGYKTHIIEHYRSKNSFFGRIKRLADFLSFYQFSSKNLINKIKSLENDSIDSKIILAGLSNGATFIDKTMKQTPDDSRVYAIEVGLPFWCDKFESKNILRINNNGADPLTNRKLDELIPNLIKTLFKLTFSRNGQGPSFAQALHISGHDYSWGDISPKVESFLEDKLQNK